MRPPDPQALLEAALAVPDPVLHVRARLVVARLGPADADTLDQAVEGAVATGQGPLEAQARYLRGRQALAEGRLEEAEDDLARAVALLERRRRLLGAAADDPFGDRRAPVYHALAQVHLARGEALAALATQERLALADEPLPEGPAREALEGLAREEAALEAELARASTEPEPARAEALRARLARLRVDFAATVDRLRATVPDLDQRLRVAPEDLEAAQADLPAGTAVLQPLLLDDRLVLLVFSRTTLQAIPVQVSGAELQATLTRLTRALRAGLRDPAVLDPLAERLGGWLWAPARPHLAGVETLAVAATGALRDLPFGLLRQEGRYLVEAHAPVTITHVGSLRAAPDPLALGPGAVLLVGDPDGTLPGARDEVATLRRIWPRAPVLTGSEATREALREGLSGRRMLHLATHGRIDPVSPDRSYLVLAEGDDPTGGGRLAYREIPGLAPWLSAARLVVLSACESGRPVEARGGEGVVAIQGLAAQFRRAGVETLVASLWKVDDLGTRALMERFHARLAAGEDVATALRTAQLDLVDDPAHGTPWVWAAFVVVGQWR